MELDAVSTTPFAERGAVTDEYMDAMRTIWTQDKPVFHGKYVHIDGLLTDPEAAAEASSADLGRRRERPLHAPGGADWRRVVSDRQQ